MYHLANVKGRSFFFFSFLGHHHPRQLAPRVGDSQPSPTKSISCLKASIPSIKTIAIKILAFERGGFRTNFIEVTQPVSMAVSAGSKPSAGFDVCELPWFGAPMKKNIAGRKVTAHPKIMRLKIPVSFLGQHLCNRALESYKYMEIK